MPEKNDGSPDVDLQAAFAPSDANVEAPQTSKETSSTKPKRLLTETELLMGSQPDYELRAQPRWLFFNEHDLYERHQYTRFSIRNREETATVAFRFRVKEQKMLLFMPSHGFLAPDEEVQVTVILTRSAMWRADPQLIVGRVHKFMLENTVVNPALSIPKAADERLVLARRVFGVTCCRTFTRRTTGINGGVEVSTLDRYIYTKMRAVLPFIRIDGVSPYNEAYRTGIMTNAISLVDKPGDLPSQLLNGLSNA